MEQTITDSCMKNSDDSWIALEQVRILATDGKDVVMINESKKIFRVPLLVGLSWAHWLHNQN